MVNNSTNINKNDVNILNVQLQAATIQLKYC